VPENGVQKALLDGRSCPRASEELLGQLAAITDRASGERECRMSSRARLNLVAYKTQLECCR